MKELGWMSVGFGVISTAQVIFTAEKKETDLTPFFAIYTQYMVARDNK